MTVVGAAHTAFAAVALMAGALVVARPKGTRVHRVLGWIYVASMTGLFATAFLIYRLFGGFGPFHWLAVVGATTLAGGLTAVVLRRPRRTWVERHYYLMSYSYLGLLAAAGAEAAVRVPGAQFKFAAGIASVAVIGAGAVVIGRNAGALIQQVRDARTTTRAAR